MIDSGSRDRSRGDRPRGRRRAARDRAARSSPTGARATSARSAPGRADLLPDPGRDPLPRAGSPPTCEAFTLDERAGVAYGPHLPRPGHEPDDRARARSSSSPASRPTARRSCSARATPRSSRTSTPATRAAAGSRSASATSPTPRTRPSARTCWPPAGARSTTPAPPSCTPTTTPPVEFMRRYFDEYRGLRECDGPRRAVRDRRRLPATCAARSAPTGAGCSSAACGSSEVRAGRARATRPPRRAQGLLRARLARGEAARPGPRRALARAPGRRRRQGRGGAPEVRGAASQA